MKEKWNYKWKPKWKINEQKNNFKHFQSVARCESYKIRRIKCIARNLLEVLSRTMRGSLALSSAGCGFSGPDLVKL
jgi:hypothetical protein